jgi:BASS family bile acid:Na+ symporter
MTLQAAIMLGIKASIVLTVFALGLDATLRDITYLFRHPYRFARSIFAIDIVMPAFVLLMVLLVPLPGPIKLALAALSVSPVPPLMPKKARKSGGSENYIIGLLVAAAVVALAFVPLSVALLGWIFGVQAHIPVSTVALLMAVTVLGPLIVGVVVRDLWPGFAERAVKPVATFALILLVVCILPILPGAWPQIMSLVGNGSVAAFTAFVLVGLAVGHFLGGPNADDRTVLAIATASRHPGMALAIAASTFPAQKLAMPAVLLYLIVSAVVSAPYAMWRKRHIAVQHGSPAE